MTTMKLKFKFLPLLLAGAILTALLSTGCSDNKTPNFPVTAGGITLESEPATVASLSPSISEIIYGIGAESKLVGRSENDGFNGPVRLLPSVGTSLQPNIEKLLDLKPNVLFSPVALSEENTQKLNEAGIQVAVLPVPSTIEALRKRISDVGLILKGNNKGPKLVAEYLTKFDNELNYVKTKLAGVERKTGVFVLGSDGSVVTGDTLLGEIMETAGLDNVAKDHTGYQISAEELAQADPQVIITTNPPGIEKLSLIGKIKNLPALERADVYELDYQYADRYSAEITYALYAIAYALYPEAMSAPDEPESGSTSSAFVPAISAPELLTASRAAESSAESAVSDTASAVSGSSQVALSGQSASAVSSASSKK